MPANDRIFKEEEVSRLLQMAIEQQEADRQHRFDSEHGLSLGEVERLASEAGIDPKYIRMALSRLNMPPEMPFKPGIWGSPTKLEITRRVPGHLTDKAIAEMLSEIRSCVKSTRGHFEKIGDSFEWTASSSEQTSVLMVRGQPDGDHTIVTVQGNFSQHLVLFHFAAFFPLFIGTLATLAEKIPQALPIGIAIAATLFFLGRWGASLFYKSKKKDYQELMDKLETIAAENLEEANNWSYESPSRSSSSKPIINLDEADSYRLGDNLPARNRKRSRS